MTKELPRLTNELPVVVVRTCRQTNINKEFKINKKRVENVLKYLCKHSSSFIEYGIKISEENLNLLPENGIPNNLNEIEETFDETNEAAHVGVEVLEEIVEKDDYHAFIY